MTIATVIKGVELVFLCILAILACVLLIVKFFQKVKANKLAKAKQSNQMDKVEQAETELAKLVGIEDNIMSYIEAAEGTYASFKELAKGAGMSGKFGSTKLNDVLGKIKTDCLTSGIAYDQSYWEGKVNRLIAFSKRVNAR